MPWYRVNGLMVHIRMTNTRKRPAPAPCLAQIEVDGKRTPCFGISVATCDFKLSDGRECNMPLCDAHAAEIGENQHRCPKHHQTKETTDGTSS